MNFEAFRKISLEELNWYFQILQDYTSATYKSVGFSGKVLFPNLILFTETKDHFLVELFGINEKFQSLDVKLHKEKTVINYLSQDKLIGGGEKERFILEGGINGGVSGIFIRRELDYEVLKKRFPFHQRLWDQPAQFVLQGGDGYYFDFKDTFKHCYMNNCTLGNKFGNIHRIKHMLLMLICGRNLSENEYKNWLNNLLSLSLLQRVQMPLNTNFQETLASLNPLLGIQVASHSREEISFLTSQFSNFFLIPGVAETSISDFLKKNPSFTKAAFSCRSFICQAQLPWLEGNPAPDEQMIIPDLFLEREDGYFDICDLKLPKHERNSITKGPRRRRRFIDYVNEGISQLANYEDYFKFQENANLANSKFGIKVSKPRLFLVVGSYENATEEEIKEAARSLRENFYIVDYDTLASLAFNNSRIFPFSKSS